jgi:hypothetical protein
MIASVSAVSPSRFEAFLEQRRAQLRAADQAAAIQRKQVSKQIP